MQHAWKVGLLVVVFVGLIISAYSFVGRSLFQKPPMRIKAEFADAGGVTPGARVLMAGVKIGSVESVRLSGPKVAEITLAIDHGIEIPKKSTAVMQSSFIGIGDSPIEIVPGDMSEGTLVEGDLIAGRRMGAFEALAPDLLPSLNTTLDEVNKTLAATRKLVEDQDIRKQLVAVLDETASTLKSFSRLAANATSTLNENRETIRVAMASLATAMKDVQRASAMAAKLIDDPTYAESAKQILASLADTSKRASEMMDKVYALVGDTKLKESIDQTLANVNEITKTGTKVAANSEEITANGIEASKNVVELTKKANELADNAKTVLDKLQKLFERPAGAVNPLSSMATQADLIRDIDSNRWRADLNFRFPISGGAVHAGIYDAFESSKFNLQLGRPLGTKGEYRYGIYAGQPGIGVDYGLAPRIRLRTDLYGLNEPRMDIRTQIDFRNDLLGWFGINRVGDGNSLAAGIGIRR